MVYGVAVLKSMAQLCGEILGRRMFLNRTLFKIIFLQLFNLFGIARAERDQILVQKTSPERESMQLIYEDRRIKAQFQDSSQKHGFFSFFFFHYSFILISR